MKILEFSESTITIYVNEATLEHNNRKLTYILENIKERNLDGILDYSISYTSMVIYYLPNIIESSHIKEQLITIERSYSAKSLDIRRIVEIPVCYDAEFGLDHHRFEDKGLNVEDIISLHTEKDYLIYMTGFLPGFPFLNGINKKLEMDRLATPRTVIPKGSVGIAGTQTGFYPTASPGGWNIIGKTPLSIGIDNEELNVPYSTGDYIRFTPLNRNEFNEIKALINEKKYVVNILEEVTK